MPNAQHSQTDFLASIRQVVACHLVETQTNPRDITFDTLKDDLSEALHWDALDDGTCIDAELTEHDEAFRLAFTDCQLAMGQESSGCTIEEALLPFCDPQTA